jgi:hypothetical protein
LREKKLAFSDLSGTRPREIFVIELSNFRGQTRIAARDAPNYLNVPESQKLKFLTPDLWFLSYDHYKHQ